MGATDQFTRYLQQMDVPADIARQMERMEALAKRQVSEVIEKARYEVNKQMPDCSGETRARMASMLACMTVGMALAEALNRAYPGNDEQSNAARSGMGLLLQFITSGRARISVQHIPPELRDEIASDWVTKKH